MDAESELSSTLEVLEATRGDIAELRHEMRRELDVIKVRLDSTATKADLQELRTEFQELRTELRTEIQVLRTEIQVGRTEIQVVRTDLVGVRGDLGVAFERGLRAQTRWMLAMLATFLVALYFKS